MAKIISIVLMLLMLSVLTCGSDTGCNKVTKSGNEIQNSIISGKVILEGETDHSGVTIHIHDQYGEQFTTTNATGDYSIVVNIGNWDLDYVKAGFESQTWSQDIKNDNTNITCYTRYMRRTTAPPPPAF